MELKIYTKTGKNQAQVEGLELNPGEKDSFFFPFKCLYSATEQSKNEDVSFFWLV